ncbi:hypothetical protein F2Q69_00029655 [Brassica cretica]|uniref:Uncharacterized protein n=1 Tax=Brassica cretica TaxID=69181 RepID=A0A8S9RTP0_BRACR|nr:hypothetical protein F2Q69_00029655 [Brassica cretica]
MLMNKNTSAAGKSSNPPPLNLVDYSDDEEKTTPQQSQTSQPLSEDLHTAAKQLSPESDVESEPVGSTKKKENISKENRGKAIEVSSGESEEEDDSENTDSDEAEEVDAENVEPSVSTKEKEKKRKAPSSATQSNPVRKSTRKTAASGIKSQGKAKTTSRAERQLEKTVTCLGGYIPEIVKEFYAALPGEMTRAS